MSTSEGPSAGSTPSTPSSTPAETSTAPAAETSAPATPSPEPASGPAPAGPAPADTLKPAPPAPEQQNAVDKQKEQELLKELKEQQKKQQKKDEEPAPFLRIQPEKKFAYDCDGPNSKLSMQFNEKHFKDMVDKLKQDKKFNAKYDLKVENKGGKLSVEVTQKGKPDNKCTLSYDNEKGLEIKGSKITGLAAAYEGYKACQKMMQQSAVKKEKDTFTNAHVSIGGGDPDQMMTMKMEAMTELKIKGIEVEETKKMELEKPGGTEPSMAQTLAATEAQTETQARTQSMSMKP